MHLKSLDKKVTNDLVFETPKIYFLKLKITEFVIIPILSFNVNNIEVTNVAFFFFYSSMKGKSHFPFLMFVSKNYQYFFSLKFSIKCVCHHWV